MQKTSSILLVKFVTILIIAAVAFALITRNTWGWILLVAILGTVITYFIGDLMILPSAGNVVTALANGVMGSILAYIVDLLTPAFDTTLTSLVVFGVLVAVSEYLLHQYLVRKEEAENKL